MKDDKLACSLDADRLGRRLAEIGAIGAEALIARKTVGGRHVLRFKESAETRRRLEEIVAAEAECCSFLDLELNETGTELVLAVAAPPRADAVAAGLAEAFDLNEEEQSSRRTG